jgi:hypothetical protein
MRRAVRYRAWRFERRGMALVLVLGTVLFIVTLAGSFLVGQSTAIGLAANMQKEADARFAAESGLAFVLGYLEQNDNWRSELAQGTWTADAPIAGATFTITAEDGRDLDGDGVISVPLEGDGDIGNDAAAAVTLTVTGTSGAIRHRLRALVLPSLEQGTLLFVVPDAGDLLDEDSYRKALFESWGYEVVPISASSSQSSFNDSFAGVDVAYVTEEVYSNTLDEKLRYAPIGVVNEERRLVDEFGIAANESGYTGTSIAITNNTHPITSGLSIGTLQILTSSSGLHEIRPTFAPGAVILATRPSDSDGALVIVEAGDELRSIGLAAARRVQLPWGNDGFDPALLNGTGLTIMRRAIDWARQTPPAPGPILHYDFAAGSGTTVTDLVGDVDLVFVPGNGAIEWVTDPQAGSGIYFNQDDGSGTAVAWTSSASTADPLKSALQATDAMTVQVFIKAEGFDGSDGRIISHAQDTGDSSRNFSLAGDESGGGRADYVARINSDGSADSYQKGDAITLNQYHVLAVTATHVTGDDNISLYVDGLLVRTGDQNGDFDDWTSERLTLGNESTLNRPFRGSIYDVKIWDRALSGAQLYAAAQAMLPAEEEEAQLIALYEFDEIVPNPQLVAHWKLDEVGSAPTPVMALTEYVGFGGSSAVIDSYDSSLGAYGGANVSSNAVVSVNAVGSDKITLWSQGILKGDAFIGPGGNPSSGITTWSGAQITGQRGTLDTVVPMPTLSAPTGPPFSSPHEGDQVSWGSMVVTINSNRHFRHMQLWNSSKVVISGDVTILLEGRLEVGSGTALEISPGSTLHLYVKDLVSIGGDVNVLTADPSRLEIFMLGSGKDIQQWGSAKLHARVQNPSGKLLVWNQAQFYGTYLGRRMEGDSGIHVDLSGAGGMTTATEEVSALNGSYTAGPVGGDPGAVGTAVRFDGTNDYVLVPHSDDLLLDNGTVSLWFKSSSLSGHRGLFSKDSTDYDTGGHLHVYTEGSTLKVRLQSTSGTYTVQSGGLTTGTWYHATVTFGGGGLKLHVNGIEKDDDDYTGGLGTSSGGTGNHEPLVFGANSWGSGNLTHTPLSDYFSGWLDDVRVYDWALDAQQIANLHAGAPIGPSTAKGAVVADTSEFGTALDLTIADTDAITWIEGGGLRFDSATKAVSAGAATKIIDALTETDEMTLEVVFTPANTTQDGPARIVSCSSDAYNRNFTFGQEDGRYVQRLRTTSTSSNGTPDIQSASVLTTAQHHVIVTYDGEYVRMYRNGSQEVAEERTGTFNWNSGYRFLLANEHTNDRPWLGTLHRVAVYDRALSTGQVNEVFGGSAPGAGEGSYTFDVRWLGRP